jgi:hypothetical protein
VDIGPITQTWTAVHTDIVAGRSFTDRMENGPFASWQHVHSFEPVDDTHAILDDNITYTLPRVPFARLVGGGYVRERLQRMFAYRHATTRLDLALSSQLQHAPLTVGVTGASGLIGTELCGLLSVLGHHVKRFVRKNPNTARGDILWNPESGDVDKIAAHGLDVVVHLAGENIGASRLTDDKKQRILATRHAHTAKLVAALSQLQQKPRAFIAASAIGFYGDRGATILDEDAGPGQGFLPDVCVAWENAAHTASTFGMRTALLRVGVVLSPLGGALAQMLPTFSMGVGGTFGDGAQMMSVLSLDEVAAMFARAVVDTRVEGVLNAVGREPVSNAEFTRTLAHVLSRPAWFAVPKVAARALIGPLADEALLASAAVVPAKLQALGHTFRHNTLEDALRHVLGRAPPLLDVTTP